MTETAQTKKPKNSGRAKGTPNKVSKELKAVIKDFIEVQLEDLTQKKKWDNLDVETKWNVILKMATFVIPKKQEQSFDEATLNNLKSATDKINDIFNKK